MFPVRCFTCGKVIGDLWISYKALLQDDVTDNDALNKLNITRYCCRRMFISHVDLTTKLLMYNCPNNKVESDNVVISMDES